jgi:protein-disulfide isomerase
MLTSPAQVGRADVAQFDCRQTTRFPMRPTQPQMSRRERRAQARMDPRQQRHRPTRPGPRPAWQSPVLLVTVAAIAIGLGIVIVANRPAPRPVGELLAPPTSYTADLVDGDVLGSSTAPVTMELYADFQCPACKLFATTELPRLWSDFIQPGTLRIEARDVAFLGTGNPNESVELAAGAACAAEQDRYWRFHDYVFWNQGRENKGDHSPDFIAQIAGVSGADIAAWQACFTRDDIRATIRQDTSVATGKGISSTPTLVINGESMVGVPSYDKLAARIRELAGGSTAPTASPS